MTYLDRAIKDGYAIITGPENKQKIIYVTSDNHTENYNDPEEKVRAEFWAELIYEYDYPAHRIKVEVTIPDRVPTDRADIVIFSDDECKKPYAVVECKRDGVTDAEFLQAIEQGVGNATWVKLRASYVVIIAGATRRVLDFSDDSTGILERENNIIADLPKAYGNHRLSAADEVTSSFKVPFCLVLCRNTDEESQYSRAIFHNINSKQIPLKLEENLKVILTSENAFSNEVLKTDPSFGWAYYLARVAAKNINFSEYPFINLLIQQEKYTFLKETFDSLLNSGYLPKADIAFDMFSGQLPEIDHALREAQLHSLPQNIAVIGALSFYKLTDQNKYHRFICWIKENCIADAPNIHMHDLISIYDKVFENSPKSVFMSMKFGEETVNTYQTVKDVKEILKRENNIDLKIIKVDEHEDGYSDEIYHRIIDGIREASLVIADLSYGNKNVHHEIGYAQGIGKKVLLIYQIRDGIDPKEEIGSNISMHDQLRFTNIVELRSQLLKRIRNFFGIPESTD